MFLKPSRYPPLKISCLIYVNIVGDSVLSKSLRTYLVFKLGAEVCRTLAEAGAILQETHETFGKLRREKGAKEAFLVTCSGHIWIDS